MEGDNMNKEYKQVPDILTGKDLDYLKDMFGWNFNSYKVIEDYIQYIEDKEINKIFTNFNEFLYENMEKILSILEDGGYNE